MKRKTDVLDFLKHHGQHHLIRHFHVLAKEQQREFVQNITALDIELALKLMDKFSRDEGASGEERIEPAPVIALPNAEEERHRVKAARNAGNTLLDEGRVAVLIVAGGQGSRLGFEGPKGTYSISPIRNKTLFQLFAEQIRARVKRYGKTIPLVVMTSIENHADTTAFFAAHDYFGLGKKNVLFFPQQMLPAVTPEGKFLLSGQTNLFSNPDGHGGSLKGLHESGILGNLMAMGITELYYAQVDNPLVKICDPVFLGHHCLAGAEVSTKVVRRRTVEERVGVYLKRNGKEAIVEYSDLAAEHMSALDEKGEILYWAGNTAIHIFSLPFVRRINEHGFSLPYHRARKKNALPHHSGRTQDVEVWKFETFVFDAIPLAKHACAMEIAREEEFAPVKNKTGEDSSQTARKAMISLHRKWVERTGVRIDPEVAVEISPLAAVDEEEFLEKTPVQERYIDTDIYIGD